MTDLVHERAELLSGLHLGKQSDPAAIGHALGRRNVLGIVEGNSLCLDERHQPFAISCDIASHFGELGKLFAFGLADIEDIHGAETVKPGLRFSLLSRFRCGLIWIRSSLASDHRSQDENPSFASANETAQRVPGTDPGNIGRIRLLPRDPA